MVFFFASVSQNFCTKLYDRKSDTYWTQVEGRAIIGELTGKKLKPLSIDTVIWGNWKKFHPDSEVLSRATGFSRSYGLDPYGNYYLAEELMFPVENMDRSLHPKEVILGIEIDGVYKAYREAAVIQPHFTISDIQNRVYTP